MQGDRLVTRELNKNLDLLLVTIDQCFLHTRILKSWGFEELGEHFFKQSIKETKPADDLIERILFLEGLPSLQDSSKLLTGGSAEEILSCDLQKEQEKHKALIGAIALCEEKQDCVSRDLLKEQKGINEERIDRPETRQKLVIGIGLADYLQIGVQEN